MRASSTMTRDVIVVVPEVPLSRAWEMMQEHRIRHLPVVQGGRLVGMLSDRDLLLRARQAVDGTITVEDQGAVGEVMTPDPVVCTRATTVSTLAELMIEKHVDGIPVVDTAGRLVGLVTSADLLHLLIEPNQARTLPFEFRVRTAHPSGEMEANA